MKNLFLIALIGLVIYAVHSQKVEKAAEDAALAQACNAERLAALNHKPGDSIPKRNLACISFESIKRKRCMLLRADLKLLAPGCCARFPGCSSLGTGTIRVKL